VQAEVVVTFSLVALETARHINSCVYRTSAESSGGLRVDPTHAQRRA